MAERLERIAGGTKLPENRDTQQMACWMYNHIG
jgi:hypothetical protein